MHLGRIAAPGLVGLALAAAFSVPTSARPQDDDDDDRRVLAARAVQENCLICHGKELITSQRLTPKQWKAEVEKMVGWGSPLPADRRDGVVDYLAREYPDTAGEPAVARITYDEAVASVARQVDPEGSPAGSAARGGPLFQAHCANCHGSDAQGAELGPNLVERPVVWRKAEHDEIVRKGRGRMPGFAASLKPADEADLLAWLRGRRYRVVPPARL